MTTWSDPVAQAAGFDDPVVGAADETTGQEIVALITGALAG